MMQRHQPRLDRIQRRGGLVGLCGHAEGAGCSAGGGGRAAVSGGAGTNGSVLVSSRHSRAERRPDLVAMHDHVDHAVLFQILGALKAVRQFLADRLLDHARAGKTDQRAGLGDMDVAEHRVGRGDAAGGRIGQHDDVGLLRLAQHLHRDRGARHLHQRQNAFLHARAAGGCEHDEGRGLLDRKLEALDDGFAGGHAERATHEIKILHGGDDRHALEPADSRPSPRRSGRSWRAHPSGDRRTCARRGISTDRRRPVGSATSYQVSLSKIDFRRAVAPMRM